MSTTTGTGIIGIGSVSVTVSDQDKALAFYVDVLGFEKRRDIAMGGGGRWIEVAPRGAYTTVSLVPARDGVGPGGYDTGIRLQTRDTEADHAALEAKGVDIDSILRWPGVPPMFSFRDLDGNTLYLVQNG